MPSPGNPGFDIAIMGRGVRDIAHMTLESLEVLRACKRGFVVAPNQEFVDGFRRSLVERTKCDEFPPLVSLSNAYQKDRLRTDNYVEAARTVLEAARSEHPVAYLTPGNPVIYDRVTQEILQGARSRGMRTKIVPAISFLDTILVDLEQEMAPGLQIFEASWIVGADVKLDTRFACMLVQTSLFCTNFPVIDRAPQTNALQLLRDHLLKFYPSTHVVVLVRSGSGWSGPPIVRPMPLAELDNVPGDIQLGASMYIPPLTGATLDEQFAARMSSVENLRSLYPDGQ